VRDAARVTGRLAACKAELGHDNWLPWLEREFGWTEMTASAPILDDLGGNCTENGIWISVRLCRFRWEISASRRLCD